MKLIIDDERAEAIQDGIHVAPLDYLKACIGRLLADRQAMIYEITRLRRIIAENRRNKP